MEKTLKLNSNIEFLNDDAYASVSLNPYFQWAKVVITDDLPNANKQRVPETEFDNLIKTGTLSPVKMEYGKPTDHKDAMGKPIGTIAQIVKETNKLIALLALWKKERPTDVAMLKDMYTKNVPPQVSWEISYAESEYKDDIEDLKGAVLTGLTVVENPAYTGRTAFVAMSSLKSDEWTHESVDELLNNLFSVAEPQEKEWLLDNLKKRLLESNSSLEDNMTLEELQAKYDQLETEHTQLKQELQTKQAELDVLKSYKETVEAEKAKAEKESKIRTKFKEANVEKDETYFNENMPKFLEMSDELLDFIVQEFVAFSQKKTDATNRNPKVPPVTGTGELDLDDPLALGRALRELKTKK